MGEITSPAMPPNPITSGRFRVHPVIGDAMEPTLRGGRDYVLTAPVTEYSGEGMYLVDFGLGIELFTVTNTLARGEGLRLSRTNPRYGSYLVDREKFSERVVGIVVADILARDEQFLKG